MSQLEWSWLEDEGANYYMEGTTLNTGKLFNENSSRVDLDFTQNGYSIPLIYNDTGKLYYRVRAAYRNREGNITAGPWSNPVSFTFLGHERSLNWQSATSFAENGKRKTVVQYSDGTLRTRQTVTKDNTTGKTVVGETIYDMQGRPNVQIL